MGMLEVIGGECAGALSLLPQHADVPVANSADTKQAFSIYFS